jgi:hypothetical protein
MHILSNIYLCVIRELWVIEKLYSHFRNERNIMQINHPTNLCDKTLLNSIISFRRHRYNNSIRVYLRANLTAQRPLTKLARVHRSTQK